MIPLVEESDMIKSKRVLAKSKNNKYGYMKKNVQELVPIIYKGLEEKSIVHVKTRDIAREFKLTDKSSATICAGLRYLMFFEGIGVSMDNHGPEELLRMGSINRFGYRLPKSALAAYDNMDLDGWYIKRRDGCVSIKHSIIKNAHKDDNGKDIYTLKSDGDIYFDRRDLTEEQTIEFAKYMSCGDGLGPDVVYMTPINVTIPDSYNPDMGNYCDTDFDKIGREFRIVKSGNESEFTITSIYGKECIIYEHDIDSIIKHCSIYSVLRGFEQALTIEKIPERIEILKRVLPSIKTKYSVVIEGRRVIVTNSAGTFQLSLIDGTLHKIYNGDIGTNVENGINVNTNAENRTNSKYICVGPRNFTENFIVCDGNKYKIDRTTSAILSKVVMLLEEKYPDERTISQIKS